MDHRALTTIVSECVNQVDTKSLAAPIASYVVNSDLSYWYEIPLVPLKNLAFRRSESFG